MWTSAPCKRLILEVSPEEHEEVKKRALEAETTIRGYLYGAVRLRIDLEDRGKGIRPQD